MTGAALLVSLVSALPAHAVESGPQGVVRQFCQADAFGRRVTVQGWATIGPLVEWALEPAWDHVALTTGYEVGSPRQGAGDTLALDVQYSVVGQVSAAGLETGVHVETVTFNVHAPEHGWRIVGPPPPPHVFANRVEVEPLQRSFAHGGVNFLPNSLFVWQLLQSAGWHVRPIRTTDLLSSTDYRAVAQPKVGDLVVYERDGVPYHVGLLETPDRVVSSTLNAGVVRAAIDAFAGQVQYVRLVQPEGQPTALVAAATPRPRARRPPASRRGRPSGGGASPPRTPIARGVTK